MYQASLEQLQQQLEASREELERVMRQVCGLGKGLFGGREEGCGAAAATCAGQQAGVIWQVWGLGKGLLGGRENGCGAAAATAGDEQGGAGARHAAGVWAGCAQEADESKAANAAKKQVILLMLLSTLLHLYCA